MYCIFRYFRKKIFFTPKMIKLKHEEEYQILENEIYDTFTSRLCYKCGSNTKNLRYSNMLVCNFFACKARFSIFKNSFFENSKLSVLTTIKILDLWLEGITPELISNIASVNVSSVQNILSKLKKFNLLNYYLNNVNKIGGNNNIVKIDESKFGKRKYNKGHRVEGVWIVGAVDRVSRRIVLKSVLKRDFETLFTFCKSYIKKDSVLYSDCWRGYVELKTYFTRHSTVNHSKNFVNPENNVHTNTIEGNWSGIKKTIPFRCRTFTLIDNYLLRFMLKRNELKDNLKILIKLLNSISLYNLFILFAKFLNFKTIRQC